MKEHTRPRGGTALNAMTGAPVKPTLVPAVVLVALVTGLAMIASPTSAATQTPAPSEHPAPPDTADPVGTPAPAASLANAAHRDSGPAVDSLVLNGFVVDSTTSEPLRGASVRLMELDRRDLTHDDGDFHLRRIPPGTYTVVVEYIGYRTARVPVEVMAGMSPVTIRLESSAIDLPGLIVTATVGARSREDALRPTQVMSGSELQSRLDVTLASTLEGEAGLASASMGPAPARPVIRGLGGDRILILEDGGRVGDVSSSSPDHAVALETSSAERIEVVRGPATLFYGSNALGGVVNVVREEIPSALPDHPSGSVMVQGQSAHQGGVASGTYRQAFGPVGLRVEASGRTAGDVRTPLGTLPNTQIETWGGSAGGAWIAGFGHAGVSARAFRSGYGIPPDSVSGHAEGVRVEMERDAYRGEAVYTRGGVFEEVTATTAYTRYDHREIEAGGVVGSAFGQNTASGEVVARNGALGPFDQGGFGVRGQWRGYISDNSRDLVESDELSAALYGMQELAFDRFRLQFGARYDIHDIAPEGVDEVQGIPVRARTFQNVSGSLAGLLDVRDGVRLGASVSRSFRAPSSDELYSQGPHLAAYTYEVGNPDLSSETGLGVDVFLRGDGRNVSAEVAAFWNEIADYSYPSNTGERRGDLFVYRYLNTDARFLGAELSARWEVGPVALDTDASYVRATNLVTDEPLPMIPPLNGRASVRWDRERYYLEVGWKGAAAQDRVPDRPALPDDSPGYCDETPAPCRPVPGEFIPTPAHSVLNAGAGFRWFPGHQVHAITLRLDNVTDQVYRNHLSRIKELSPEPGFGATLSYRIAF